MATQSSQELTELLRGWRGGNESALARVVELTYPELQKLARGCLKGERPGHTIQATALINEAYLRLVDVRQVSWQDRAHFFAIVAKLMRRILTDHARAHACSKRGGRARRMNFHEELVISAASKAHIIELDEALDKLAKFDARKAQVVEMRYFGGLSAGEIASVLNISPQSVNRDWSLAKAWLSREMGRKDSDGRPALGSD